MRSGGCCGFSVRGGCFVAAAIVEIRRGTSGARLFQNHPASACTTETCEPRFCLRARYVFSRFEALTMCQATQPGDPLLIVTTQCDEAHCPDSCPGRFLSLRLSRHFQAGQTCLTGWREKRYVVPVCLSSLLSRSLYLGSERRDKAIGTIIEYAY